MTSPVPGGPAAPSSALAASRAAVDAGQTRLLYDNLPAGLVGTVFIAGILAALLVGGVPTGRITIWMAVMVAVSAARYVLLLAYRRNGAPADGHWQQLFEIGALASGLAWALASIWLFPVDHVRQAFMGFVLGSMAAGAISTLGVHLRAYTVYLLPALVPYTTMLVLDGGSQQIGMALVFALGQVVLLVSARRFSELTRHSFALKHDNDQLVDALRSALEAANEASRAKSRFLANMSHEIRTPMNGVLGMTEVLQRTALETNQARIVGTIGQSARTLLTIIDDILDLARIEEGRLKPDLHAFMIEPCVEDVVALLSDLADRKGLALVLEIDGDTPAMVEGDAGRLRQVLLNLIGNAIKFTEAGEVGIRVALDTASAMNGALRFDIRDTGIGMTAETQAQIFQPFVQADSSIRRRFGGSGLGLAISHHLVRMMGGTLGVTSGSGTGTTMSVTLPLPRVGDALARSVDGIEALRGRQVLVVDPVETRRRIVARYLGDAGASVTAAASIADVGRPDAGSDGTSPVGLIVAVSGAASTHADMLAAGLARAPALASVPVVLVAPVGIAAAPTGGVGNFARRIPLPVRRAELLAAAAGALTGAKPADVARTAVPGQLSVTQLRLDILVAEDNPVNQLVAEDSLATLGCAVTMVCDGEAAVDKAKGRDFDVILMDCQMPVLDGLAATRRIREHEAATGARRTPIVAVTANAYEEDRRLCLDAGMDDFIAKPFTIDALAETLLRWKAGTGGRSADRAAA